MKQLMAIAALFLMSTSGYGQTSDNIMEQHTAQEAAILQVHDRLYQALVAKEESPLQTCLHPAFRFTSANADVQQKEQFLTGFALNPLVRLPSVVTSEKEVTIVDRTAVVTALAHIRIIRNTAKDNTVLELWERLTETYVLQHDRWQLLAMQATYIPKK